jgi:hypothetical protein
LKARPLLRIRYGQLSAFQLFPPPFTPSSFFLLPFRSPSELRSPISFFLHPSAFASDPPSSGTLFASSLRVFQL